MRYLKVFTPVVVAWLAGAGLASAQTTAATNESREANLHAYVSLLRSDLRSEKSAIVAEVMQFTEAEDQKFWPIYREYETELAAINTERMALVKEYALVFDSLTDAVADKLASGTIALESRRNTLTAKYYDRFKSALSAKTAARFLQVERQILLLLDLQIAAALPVVSR
jgi:hypothetical protein